MRLVAPGSAGDSEIPPMVNFIESIGMVPNITENIYQPFEPFFHSNTDDFRVNDLISALTDNSKVIWCIRGGRGNSRLIPLLEQRLPSTLDHKIFIGQSDITVLHLYLQKKYGWQTIHGSNLDYVGVGFYEGSAESQASLVALTDLILDRKDSICLPLMAKFDERPAVAKIESRVVGGNIELVETSLGAFWQIETRGRIVFLEGVGEAAWRTERSLDHMKHAGIFDHVEAVVFGDFTSVDNYTLVEIVLKRFAQEMSFPVFKLSGVGHGPINYPVPLLAPAEITRIESDTFQLCIRNVNGDIVHDVGNGSYSKHENSFTILVSILSGLVSWFAFQKL